MADGSPEVVGEVFERQIVGPVLDVLARMPDAVQAIETIAFASLQGGTPVDPSAIARSSGRTQPEIAEALDLMVSVGAAKVDSSGSVVGVHGLSLERTAHELTMAGVHLFTWCAVDALGIPVGLRKEGLVRTSCPECGSTFDIVVRDGRICANGEPVAWCPTSPCTNLADGLCRQLNLYCGREHLDSWRARSGHPQGVVMALADIEENGRRVWGREAPRAEMECGGCCSGDTPP